MHRSFTRRAALLGLGAAISVGRVSLALAAAPMERRFVVVLLRGALDGLAAVAPYGDPAYAGLRGALALPQPGKEGGALDLGGRFGLHPALLGLHGMYRDGEMLPIHAVAGPVRTRSHFEAQDIMESGAEQRLSSGWLNRAVQGMPTSPHGEPLSVGVVQPLLLRGPTPVGAYAPQSFSEPQADLYARLVALHARDAVTGPALREGLRERGFTDTALGDTRGQGGARFQYPALAAAAGRLLAAADGPRIAAMELGGWDTHAAQSTRLVGPLKELDAGLLALKEALGPQAWRQTAVLVITEFGRTVRVNGTGGTDHGTGGVAFVVGGAVAGGRIGGTWPGLGAGRLFEDRDLAPTTDLRAVAKGLLADHLRLPSAALARAFPGSGEVGPMGGLIRT